MSIQDGKTERDSDRMEGLWNSLLRREIRRAALELMARQARDAPLDADQWEEIALGGHEWQI